MSEVLFELNREGVSELLKSEAMMDICKEYAQQVQNRAGEGYELTTYVGKTRVNASVAAVTDEAKRDNMDNNTLLKSLK